MAVPILNLPAQYAAIKDEIDAAVAEVFQTQGFVGGPKVKALEQAVAALTGAPHAVAVASGTDALLLSLKALGAKPGAEVITSPFTFFATAGAIANAGAAPVFADIDPRTYNLDPRRVEDAVTERTAAILPVHLYGHCADMDLIIEIAARHNVPVLEDAAQAIGAQYKGRGAGSMGQAGALSFYPTKNLGGAGDAGMVVASNETLAGSIRRLANHGGGRAYYHDVVGFNSRLDAVQAAVLLVKLAHLEAWNEARRAHAAYYTAQFAEIPEVVTPVEQPACRHVYHQYVIRLPQRDRAREILAERGVGCAVFYPLPLHKQPCFESYGCAAARCPEAERAADEVLALPIYAELTQEQQDEVVDAVRAHLAAL